MSKDIKPTAPLSFEAGQLYEVSFTIQVQNTCNVSVHDMLQAVSVVFPGGFLAMTVNITSITQH